VQILLLRQFTISTASDTFSEICGKGCKW